jgi:hypothetical protein
MATENRWRARKIQAELSKLGIRVSLATISRVLPKAEPDPGCQQRWTTFLRNHRDLIAGMDFFVVPTLRFQLLYVWFVIDHGRRRILHFNVTESSAACWLIQQLREAFPDEPSHRFLILDNDSIFSAEVAQSAKKEAGHHSQAHVVPEPMAERPSASSEAYLGSFWTASSCSARIT